MERSYTSKTVEKLAKSNQRKSSKSCKKTTSEIVPQWSHICSLSLGDIFEIITRVNQSVYSFYLLNCQTKSFYKVWWRTSRQSRWLRQSWSQGRDHRSHQSWRWSRTRSSLVISQTLSERWYSEQPIAFKHVWQRNHQKNMTIKILTTDNFSIWSYVWKLLSSMETSFWALPNTVESPK